MLTSAVLRMVGFCTRHPWPVIVIAALLTVVSALYTSTNFAITTDTDQLLPKDLPWRRHEQAYRDAFPQDQILVVVEGPTTELVEMAADRLAAELRARDGRFPSVRRPQGSEFLQRSALLFLRVDQVTDTAGRLAAAKPLIEVLAADPSLRGVMHALTIGIGAGQGAPYAAGCARRADEHRFVDLAVSGSLRSAGVACQIDKLQHGAIGIMEIGARAVEHAASPVLLEGDLDATSV